MMTHSMRRKRWTQRSTANTTHWTNVGSMLAQRLRRWPNIKTTLFQCLVFAVHRGGGGGGVTQRLISVCHSSSSLYTGQPSFNWLSSGKVRVNHSLFSQDTHSVWPEKRPLRRGSSHLKSTRVAASSMTNLQLIQVDLHEAFDKEESTRRECFYLVDI